MSAYTIKKQTFSKFIGLLFAIAYGFFIVGYLHYFYSMDSGDIGSYVNFFDNNKGSSMEHIFDTYSIRGDGVFRVGVIFLGDYFNTEPITVLSYLAFIISSLFFFIFSVNIRSSKYLIYILPLFLMIFLTPMVSNLFASGIRSGIAFIILMVSFMYLKGFWKYVLFLISSLIHLSMIPIISLYILYYMFEWIRIKSPFIVPLFLLSLFSFAIVIASYVLKFNATEISSSIFFNFLVLCLGLLIIFTNKKVIKNIYGFISIGLILIYLFGLIIDLSFSRYIGNAIILYLLFLIEKGESGTIQVFTTAYVPIFLITAFYAIANNF